MRPLVALLLAAGLALGGVGCDSEPEPAPSPTTPSPSPTPTPGPVRGQAEVDIVNVAPTGVVPGGGGGIDVPAPDQRAARRFAGAVTEWLDQHLTALQDGSDLGSLRGSPLVRRAPRAAVRAVTTALAAPDRLVDGAAYRVRVATLGKPRWAQVRVVVTDVDGNRHRADFMFEPADGGPRVIAAGPADRTATPSPRPTATATTTPEDPEGGDRS